MHQSYHWNQKVGWIARGFPQQGFGPPASYYNIFFQLKSIFPIFNHLFDFIWIYLTLFDFFCFGTSLGLSCTTYLIHHMTSNSVLNPFALEAEHLTTQGNMITADSWAAILQLPFASATEPNAILDSFMWTAIFNRTNLFHISDYTECCHFLNLASTTLLRTCEKKTTTESYKLHRIWLEQDAVQKITFYCLRKQGKNRRDGPRFL